MKLLGKTVCYLLRTHKWRRLRKAENSELQITGADSLRICARCGTTRAVRARKT